MSDHSAFTFRPRRELGRTGFTASLLGLGDLADRSVPLEQCAATLRRALDAGLNVIDTAPAYEDGYSGYTLICDPDVALLGLSTPDEQDAAFAAATTFQPLSQHQLAYLRGKAKLAIAGKGPCWWNPA